MNKRIALACAVSIAVLGAAVAMIGVARASDLPSRKAPPIVPITSPSWTGFYAGGDVGAILNVPGASVLATGAYPQSSLIGIPPRLTWTAQPYTLPGVAVLNDAGFKVGAHAGYNYQIGKLVVLGVEVGGGTLFGTAGTQTFPSPTLPGQAAFSQVGRTADFVGDAVARVGVTPFSQNFMFYGLGGLAYGHANVSVARADTALAATYAQATPGSWKTGWTAGGGIEWMFMPNLSLDLRYQHFDLGSSTVETNAISSVGPAIATPNAVLAKAKWRGDEVKVGASFHFNGLDLGL